MKAPQAARFFVNLVSTFKRQPKPTTEKKHSEPNATQNDDPTAATIACCVVSWNLAGKWFSTSCLILKNMNRDQLRNFKKKQNVCLFRNFFSVLSIFFQSVSKILNSDKKNWSVRFVGRKSWAFIVIQKVCKYFTHLMKTVNEASRFNSWKQILVYPFPHEKCPDTDDAH